MSGPGPACRKSNTCYIYIVHIVDAFNITISEEPKRIELSGIFTLRSGGICLLVGSLSHDLGFQGKFQLHIIHPVTPSLGIMFVSPCKKGMDGQVYMKGLYRYTYFLRPSTSYHARLMVFCSLGGLNIKVNE